MRRTFVPDYSSRGAVQNPPPEAPRSLPPPPPRPAPRQVSYNTPPQVPVWNPIAAPVAPAAPTAQKVAVQVALPEPVTSGFSPHLETFPSLGTSYFITEANIAEQVSIWAKYPATQDVDLAGFNLNNGGAGTFAGDLAAANGNFSGTGVFNGLFSATGGANIIGDVGISSGNLTLNDGQAISNTFVAVNGPLNDPGRLVLFDNNGTQHILKSIDADLFFDNELLAKANDIQNIADWSLYPALQDVDMDGKALDNASQVTVTDGTNPQVLTASAGGLLVNGQAVATGTVVKSVNTDSGDIVLESADNSVVITKPVAGTINFAVPAGAGGVASLNAQTGAVSLSSTGASITITNPGPGQINLESATGNVADWATFPAVSAVNMQDNGINISPTPTGYPNSQLDTNLQIGKPSYVLFPTIDMYPSTFRVGGLTAPATSVDFTSLGAFTVNSGVGIALTGGGGVSIVGGGGISALGATITLGAGAVSALGGSINLGGGTINMAGGLINALGAAVNIGGGLITATTGGLLVTAGSVVVGTADIAGAGMICYGGKLQCFPSLTGGTGGLEMNSTPITGVSTINGAPYPPASFVNSFDLYVAPNGSDATGTGSQQNPFLTINGALTARAAIASTSPVVINLATGTYTENVTVVTNNTTILGFALENEVTIAGNVTFAIVGAVGLVVATIQGCSIAGGVLTVTATQALPHSITVISTNIIGGTGTLFSATNANPASSVSIVTNGLTAFGASAASPVCSFTSCRPLLIQASISNSGLASCILCNGNATLGLFGATISNSSASTAVLPLVDCANTVVPGSSYSITNSFLTYSTGTAPGSSLNKQAIRCSNSANISMSLLNTQLLCEGSSRINLATQYQCVSDTGAGSVTLTYFGNFAGATAHHIASTIAKTAFTAVP